MRHLFDLIDTHEHVDFGHEFGEFLAIALGQATCNDQALTEISYFAHFGRLQDGVDAFFLSTVDEGAGVDDDDVRFFRSVGDGNPILDEISNHDFRIDQVLGTS